MDVEAPTEFASEHKAEKRFPPIPATKYRMRNLKGPNEASTLDPTINYTTTFIKIWDKSACKKMGVTKRNT